MADQSKPLSQDDIDALIGEFAGASAEPAAKSDGPPAAAMAMLANQAKDPDHVVQPIAKATHSLGQDDLDALINQEHEQAEAAAPATRPSTRREPSSKTLAAGTKRIEDILASVETKATLNAQAQLAGTQAEPAGPLGQDDIDRLLAELGASTPTKSTAKKPPTGPAVRPATGPATATATNASVESTAPLTKSAAAAAATLVQEPPRAGDTPVPGGAPGTLALSPEDIDALVSKQAGIESDHGEAPMIDQGDIDALVKQLATATGAPDTKRISDALAKHEGEIDKLLEKAGDPKATIDAVDVAKVAGPTPPAKRAVAAMVPAGSPAMAVMAPGELRGTRWLLGAAVLFLGMCSATLVIVVNAIHALSHELHENRHVELAVTDSFGDDLKAALAKLASSDDGEVTKGVLFLERLKNRHPSHEADIALTLARHFRAHQAHRQAVEQFAALSDSTSGGFEDPRIYLDYADSLARIGEQPAAIRQIYLLLANEDAYLGAQDRHGLARPADEVARNKQALQDAYLALGRLLGEQSRAPAATGHGAESHGAHPAEGAAHAGVPAAAAAGAHAPAPATGTEPKPPQAAPADAEPAAEHRP